VDFLTKFGKPQAAWYAHHLDAYHRDADDKPGGAELPAAAPEELYGGSVTTGSVGRSPGHGRPTSAGNPGLLNMAFSASKSMAKFLGSGLKTVTPDVLQQRLQTCAGCENHTGVRCRLCGCFTSVKARMAHEECPIGKWTSQGG
jgi:hypothetical protein